MLRPTAPIAAGLTLMSLSLIRKFVVFIAIILIDIVSIFNVMNLILDHSQ